jgi:hypothetical protein
MPSLTAANAGANLLKITRRMLDRQVQSPDASRRVAKHLKERLEEMAHGGQLPVYRQFVDGKETKELSTVTFRGSVITIQFQLLDGVARAMLAYAKAISPRQTGAFADAWFLLVDGVPYTDFTQQIPHNSAVILTNFAPYFRRLEEQGRLGRSGRLSSYVRPELVVTERTRQWAQKQFPGALIERLFVVLPGGGFARGWQVPYVLKRGPHRGETITYPALRLTER